MDGSSFRFDGRGKAPAVWENLLKEIEDTEEALQHADLEGQRVHTTQSLPRMNHTGDMTMMLGGDDGSQRACPSRNIHGRDAQPIYNTLNGYGVQQQSLQYGPDAPSVPQIVAHQDLFVQPPPFGPFFQSGPFRGNVHQPEERRRDESDIASSGFTFSSASTSNYTIDVGPPSTYGIPPAPTPVPMSSFGVGPAHHFAQPFPQGATMPPNYPQSSAPAASSMASPLNHLHCAPWPLALGAQSQYGQGIPPVPNAPPVHQHPQSLATQSQVPFATPGSITQITRLTGELADVVCPAPAPRLDPDNTHYGARVKNKKSEYGATLRGRPPPNTHKPPDDMEIGLREILVFEPSKVQIPEVAVRTVRNGWKRGDIARAQLKATNMLTGSNRKTVEGRVQKQISQGGHLYQGQGRGKGKTWKGKEARKRYGFDNDLTPAQWSVRETSDTSAVRKEKAQFGHVALRGIYGQVPLGNWPKGEDCLDMTRCFQFAMKNPHLDLDTSHYSWILESGGIQRVTGLNFRHDLQALHRLHYELRNDP